MCCATLTSEGGSSAGYTVGDVECLLCVALAPKADCTFFRSYEKYEFEKYMWTLLGCYEGQPSPEFDPLLIMQCRIFSHIYFGNHIDYWLCDFKNSTVFYVGLQ